MTKDAKNPNSVSILQEEWDFLIILDACRYDYFEKSWKHYLPTNGHLSSRISIGTCTDEWRNNTFPDYYEDIVYISANPQINVSMPVYGYCAKDHFKHVHEIWRDNWSQKHGTVLPEAVTQRAHEIIPQYDADKKFIIHYIQPHAPYLNVDYDKQISSLEQFISAQMLSRSVLREGDSKLKRLIFRRLKKIMMKMRFLTNQPEWILRKLLRIPPILPMESAWRKLGVSGLRKAYEANLLAALPCVAKLIDSLNGTIVVTSDHGELLGEKRQFGHPGGSSDPILQNVPWYVLKKSGKRKMPNAKQTPPPSDPEVSDSSDSDKKQQDEAVIERLRALGYYE